MKRQQLLIFLLTFCMACNSHENSAVNISDNPKINRLKSMPYNTPTKLNITSSAFEAGQKIPVKYTCDGEDVNPEIKVDNLPAAVKSFAIILEDPDAPKGTFIHWLCWNLPPETIAENTSKGMQGINSFGEKGYKGPCPPKGKPHHYNFLVFALDAELDIPGNATREALEKTMQNHISAKGELQGLYGTD